MKFIGVTGGVGAGKSALLHYIEQEFPVYVLRADELAHELMRPGTVCYQEICKAFPTEDIFTEHGEFDAYKLSEVIFSDETKRRVMNGIVHPAVKSEVLRRVEEERKRGEYACFLLEAALLIEERYDRLCDELWYIDASPAIRRERLKMGRGYSDEKIDAIFASQLSKEECQKYCKVVIDNSGGLEEAARQALRFLPSGCGR